MEEWVIVLYCLVIQHLLLNEIGSDKKQWD
jgi:hypothetical protein